MQKACKHFRLGAIHPDMVLIGKLDGEELEVTDDILSLFPKGTILTLSRIQQELLHPARQPPHAKGAERKEVVDHMCSNDLLENRP